MEINIILCKKNINKYLIDKMSHLLPEDSFLETIQILCKINRNLIVYFLNEEDIT
jgi:hypothetical protein